MFDALGTLFDLGPLHKSAELHRTLHHAVALTLAGEWKPFAEIAKAVDPELVEKLAELEPYDDAREALEHAGEAWVLTNGGRDATERLLERGGLREVVAQVRSVEEVRRYKPHPDVYRLLPERSVLVAAHAWDVAGARAAGYRAVWVNREEDEWPLPLPEPLRASNLIEAVRLLLRGQTP